jgi:hypothetical protein
MKIQLLTGAFLLFAGFLNAQQERTPAHPDPTSSALCWYNETADSLTYHYLGQNILDYHVDCFGNNYTAGYLFSNYYWNATWQMIIQKFDKNGNLKWRKLWDVKILYDHGDDFRSCFCNAITSDKSGNIYITGNYGCNKLIMDSITFTSENNYAKGFIAKLDSNGRTKWAINLSNEWAGSSFTCGGSDIDYLNDNQIFVFMWGDGDLLLPTGVIQHLWEEKSIVVLDKDGNFIKSTGIPYINPGGMWASYNPNIESWNSNAVAMVSPKMYISPKSGKLFLVGTFFDRLVFEDPSITLDSISSSINGFVAVMDTTTGWQNAFVTYGSSNCFNFDSGQTRPDKFPAFAVDSSDNIYIAARWDSIAWFLPEPTMEIIQGQYLPGNKGSMIVKYDMAGNLLWYNNNSVCLPRSLSVTASNDILMYGEFDDSLRMASRDVPPIHILSNGGKDIFLASLGEDGNINWAENLGSAGDDYSWFLKSHPCSDNMYFSGRLDTTCMFMEEQLHNAGNRIFVGKYSAIGYCYDTACSNAVEFGIESYDPENQIHIFPNPFSTTITIELPSTAPISNTTLSIYNVNGQLVILRCINEPITVLDISTLPHGIYMVNLTDSRTVEVGKFVKQ